MSKKFGLLFSLPFMLAGLFIMGLAINWWLLYLSSANWDRIPVTIISNEIERHTSSEGGTSFHNKVAYTYTIDGQHYTGDRATISSGGSSGSHHIEWHEELEYYREKEEKFMAWVNPADPSESFLFRRTTMGMFVLLPFGMVFFMAGAGVCTFAFWGSGKQRRIKRAAQPWEGEGLWTNNAARSAPWKSVAITSVIALFFTMFIGVFVLAITMSEDVGTAAQAGVSSAMLIPGAIWLYALYLVRRALRYGHTHLALSEVPVTRGSTMESLLVSREPIQAELMRCSLVCTKTYWERRGNKSTHRTETLYEDEFEVSIHNGGLRSEQGYVVPITVDIPSGYQLRDQISAEKITWKLTVSAATPGVDFKAVYQLPVYA